MVMMLMDINRPSELSHYTGAHDNYLIINSDEVRKCYSERCG